MSTSSASARPFAMPVNPAGLPEDPALTGPHFLAWRWAPKAGQPGEWTKPPLNPCTGRPASVTNPAHRATLADTLAAMRRLDLDGPGLVLTKELGRVALDLDHCRDRDSGEIAPWAQAIIDRFASYTEPSASGTGIRILIRAALPGAGRKRGDVEAYDHGRYVTINGNRLAGAPATIEPRQAELDAFLAEYFPAPVAPAPAPVAPAPVVLDDEALLERARTCNDGGIFDRLFAGDLADFPDRSRADWQLAYRAAFWTHGDPARVERWMRASGLARERWDERRGTTTLLGYTVAKACREQTHHHDPLRPHHLPTFADDEPGAPADAGEAPAAEDRAGALNAWSREDLEARYLELVAAVEARDRQLAEERRALQALRDLQSATMAVLRNPHLKTEAVTALATVFTLAEAEGREETADGFHRIPLARIAENAARSPKIVGAHVAKFAEWGLIEKRTEHTPVRHVDADGEVRQVVHKDIYLRKGGATVDVLRAFVAHAPEEQGKGAWGGKRQPCPRCGETATVTTVRCAGCDLIRKETHQAAADPEQVAPPPTREAFVADRPGDWLEIMGVSPTDADEPAAPPVAADYSALKMSQEPAPAAVAADLTRWLEDGTLARVVGEVHAGGVTIAAAELPGRVADWLAQYQALADAPAVVAPGSLTGVAVRPGAGLHTALADVWRAIRPIPPAPVPIPLVVIPAPAPRPDPPRGDITYSYAPGPSPPARGGPRCMNTKCRASMPDGDTGRYCPTCRADGWGG